MKTWGNYPSFCPMLCITISPSLRIYDHDLVRKCPLIFRAKKEMTDSEVLFAMFCKRKIEMNFEANGPSLSHDSIGPWFVHLSRA